MTEITQKAAFEALFRKFQPALLRYASLQVPVLEDARELVQEVFIKVWERRNQLEFNEELKFYLYRAVKNTCINFRQKKRIDTIALDEAVTAAAAEQSESKDNSGRIATVMQQIDLLPETCREIFLMSRMEGLSHKEIAEILEIAPKTVENQVGIALKKIRDGIREK